MEDKILGVRFVQRKYALEKYELGQIKKVRAAANKAINEYLAYADLKKDAIFGQGKWTREKGLKYVDQLKKLDGALKQQVVDMTTGAGRRTFKDAIKAYEGILSFDGGVGAFNFTDLSPEKLEALVKGIPVGGNTLKEWADRTLDRNVQNKIRNELLTGSLKGESIEQLKRRVRQRYKTFSRNTVDVMVRTHVQSANNYALQKVYEENRHVVHRVKWLGTLDASSCLVCACLDGNEYNLNDHPHCPVHPRCRCVLLPVTKTWKEMGIDRAEMKRRYRPELQKDGTYKKVQKTYRQRYKEMSPGDKRAFIGPGRYDFLNKSKLDFPDLVDPKAGRLYRIDELPKVEEIIVAKRAKQAAIQAKLEAQIRKEEAKKAEAKEKAKAIKEKIEAKKLEKQEALVKKMESPDEVAVFTKKTDAPWFKPVKEPDPKSNVSLPMEPKEFKKAASGAEKKHSAGTILYDEDTGKVWLVEPKDHFGGYENTFPKGTLDKGLSAQATAIVETWEESGLHAQILGYLGDYEKTTSITRYYIAKVKGGSPVDFGWESQAVKLSPIKKAKELLNKQVDKDVFSDFEKKLASAKAHVKDGKSKSLKEAFYAIEKAEADEIKKAALLKAEAEANKEFKLLYDKIMAEAAEGTGYTTLDDVGKMIRKLDGHTAQEQLESLKKAYKEAVQKGKAVAEAKIAAKAKEIKKKTDDLLGQIFSDPDLGIDGGELASELSKIAGATKSEAGKYAKYKAYYNKLKDEAAEAKAAIRDRINSAPWAIISDSRQELDELRDMYNLGIISKREFQEKVDKIIARRTTKSQGTIGTADDVGEVDYGKKANQLMERMYQDPDVSYSKMNRLLKEHVDHIPYSEGAKKYAAVQEVYKKLKPVPRRTPPKELVSGVDYKDLPHKEKANIAQLKMKLKYGEKLPKPNTKPMKTWNKLSVASQEMILDDIIKKGGTVPADLPLKEGLTGVYVKPAQAETARKFKWLKGDNYVKYADQQGSNKGGFYHHENNPADRWYFKLPGSDDNARNEMLANKLYEKMGVEVPTLKYVDIDGQRGVASKIVDGVEKNGHMLRTSDQLRGSVHGNFVTDAFLGNWDVVGLQFDNLMIKDGARAIRIDTGGALRYRAMGSMKSRAAWNNIVGELDSMRNPSVNEQAASIFGDITQAELDAGARKVLALTDKDIKHLVNQFGPSSVDEKNELIAVLIGRRDDIQKRFPHIKIKKKAAPKPKEHGARVTKQEVDSVSDARINGRAIPTDKDQIEDQQILFWHEKSAEGKWRTMADFKIRSEAADRVDQMVLDGVTSGQKMKVEAIIGFEYELRPLLQKFSGISGTISKVDVSMAESALAQLKKAEKVLGEYVEKGTIDKTTRDLFLSKTKNIKDELDNMLLLGPGSEYQVDELYKYVDGMVPMAKKGSGESKIAWTRKEGQFEKKVIENGHAKGTGEPINLKDKGKSFQHYYEADIDGVKVRYWPNNDDVERIAFAHKGKMQIMAEGKTAKEMEAVYKTLDDLGINSARPTAMDTEELYLRQIFRHRNEDEILDHKKFQSMSQEKRIEWMKKEYNKKAGFEITDDPKYYDPKGHLQAYDQGRNVGYRPDILAHPDYQNFEKIYTLTHELYGDTAENLDRILNGGGLMAPTTDKLRRGFTWGGMSPVEDMNTGGASYFFTRIKRRDNVASKRLVLFKPKAVARLDAISYSRDNYGRCNGDFVRTNRESTLERMARISENGSNETIFKKSLSILDDLEAIQVSEFEYDKVIQVFKKHKITRLADGRKIEDVVKKI